jgi:hypothetical protein
MTLDWTLSKGPAIRKKTYMDQKAEGATSRFHQARSLSLGASRSRGDKLAEKNIHSSGFVGGARGEVLF